MQVAVTGATGVIGRGAVTSLVDAGHVVVAMTRDAAGAATVRELGAEARTADLFDVGSLTRLYDGCDAVVNLATRIPVGRSALLPWSWRASDRLRTSGVENVVAAALLVGVRRLVQESLSYVYADHGEEWVTEQHPLDITPATEPVAVAEAHVHEYATGPRSGVVLRFGAIVGDDERTRLRLRAVQRGRPVGLGRPDAWAHVVHTDDLGPAVLSALHAPTGVYNVGAQPVRRRDLVAGYAAATGVPPTGFMGPVARRVGGRRLEPLTRSLRICSEHFSAQTGWTPTRPEFGTDWFAASQPGLTGTAR